MRPAGCGMKAITSFLALIIVLAIAWFIVKTQFTHGPAGGAPPKQLIEVVGVKTDLLAIAQAERLYLASHGSYASLEQLQQDGAMNFSPSNRRGYNYSAEVNDGERFKITAIPSDPSQADWPKLSIDEKLEVTQE